MAAQSAVSTDVYSRDTVYQRLRGQIIDFTLLPGELLSENALAAQMQTSRTPVREAIARLASEHCVEVFPQRGTQVSRISMELVRRLAPSGLIDGIEVYHPRNTPEDQQELLKLCSDNHLIVTGGTDFHGSYASRRANPLGTCVTDQENLKKIFLRAKELEVISISNNENLFQACGSQCPVSL